MTQLTELIDRLDTKTFPDMTFSSIRAIANYMNSHTTNNNDIENDLSTLNTQQRDILMKVLYCCLANDSRYSATYFRWHEKLYAAAGSGAIIRVMTDRPKATGEQTNNKRK
ncbi:putative ARP2/3 complex 16kDa subunit [Trypanosoma cruzi]|uniref:Actin-related protein 2/3 complex subunit 5 n=2 Tax=Trypanosoma cruzi TaxID=5693 RepID=Q4CKA8_TRYCC|nr:ARP2/3 complex subunit, putative [Trypanosoma cruzi]EAN80710.1 ARP2/3 complex subunit, putative [Trypanosoma cruzi]PWV17300.1 putative ARP2/3 complex 16kDa subunit [Trypanosoma cruzi]RNC50524.1 ARP2/3 complex subunit [Trypanosoma cruzi]|eukprot:XP_802156.1 ARP2/3 complex subunit [Trypanosoma cruzi strain CL Brener]